MSAAMSAAGCAARKSDRKKRFSWKAELNAKVLAKEVASPRAVKAKIDKCKRPEVEEELEPVISGCGLHESEEYADLCAVFPGRQLQLRLLLKLLTGGCLPPFLYVHGTNSTGKTSTLAAVLLRLKLKHVMINCKECYHLELLYSEILSELADTDSKCKSTNSFLAAFKQLSCVQTHQPLCIVFDNAECLQGDPLLLSTLKRLAELSGSCSICVVMVSVISMHTFFANGPTLEVLPIHFPQYSKEESQQIMMLDCPSHQPLPFYETFVRHIWNVFNTVCRDLAELRHLGSSLFPKYVEPVTNGEIGHQDTLHLWKHIEPYFRTVMSRIYLRENSLSGMSSSSSPTELPFYSKYLLLASFLASYNPSRMDRRFFSKLKQPKLHKPRGHKESGPQSGPKEFSMDRMMAIFHSIISCTVPQICNQVSSLVSLQLLGQSSKSEALDCPRYKCLLELGTAQQLAKNVGFDLIHHLHDFNA